MVYTCLRCGEHKELREGKKTGNSLKAYQQMREELRKSFLKSDAELCPDCLAMVLQFVRSAVNTDDFLRRASRKVRVHY
jgi:hypothetical protein